ncbi:bone morphogenetic protein 2 [Denticeps clupeoides]|uniref:bone morphogenetic protein 2 n=1 Tax=Denticeps clupeoides TaxID=299321 RepID=UPI0010A54DBB|nr:bone morphogenetic protein 2-like [Denticeps clupeoides]
MNSDFQPLDRALVRTRKRAGRLQFMQSSAAARRQSGRPHASPPLPCIWPGSSPGLIFRHHSALFVYHVPMRLSVPRPRIAIPPRRPVPMGSGSCRGCEVLTAGTHGAAVEDVTAHPDTTHSAPGADVVLEKQVQSTEAPPHNLQDSSEKCAQSNAAMHNSSHIIEFADGTTVVGLISKDDHAASEVSQKVPKGRDDSTVFTKLRESPRSVQTRKRAPQFMMDLFDAVADSNGTTRNRGVLEGSIVRSFPDKGQPNGAFHYFNISSFGTDEKIVKAEFRWHPKKLCASSYGGMFRQHFYKVDLYEVLHSGISPWRGNLITSRLLPMYNQGWEVFNITQTVTKWIHDSQTNNGILLVTTLPSGHWIESHMTKKSANDDDEAAIYLVIFSDDGHTASVSDHMLHEGNYLEYVRTRIARSAQYASNDDSAPCQKRPLYVDFEKIGWSGWIISPRGYNAYHCRGSCPFPLGESLRATNHATVQSIVNALRLSGEVEKPCCVPDKLHSISLLYFDDEENVVLKQYDNMVAVSCGCH